MCPMKTHDRKPLSDDVESLKKIVLKLQSENQGLQQKLRHVMEQWQLPLQKRFAASTEGLPGQGSLFNELEASLEPEADKFSLKEILRVSCILWGSYKIIQSRRKVTPYKSFSSSYQIVRVHLYL